MALEGLASLFPSLPRSLGPREGGEKISLGTDYMPLIHTACPTFSSVEFSCDSLTRDAGTKSPGI